MWGADRVERKEYQDYVSRLQLNSWTAELSWFLSRLWWNDSCILRACKAWLDLTRPLRLTLLTRYKEKELQKKETLYQRTVDARRDILKSWALRTWDLQCCTRVHRWMDCNLLQTFHQVISRRRLKSRQEGWNRGSGHTETVLRSGSLGSPTFHFAWKKSNAHQVVLQKKCQEGEERHEIQNEAMRSKL